MNINIKVKLNNPKYCNGCPNLFGGIVEHYTECWYNQNYKLKVKMHRGKKHNTFKVIRSKECIKQNGA